MKGLALLCACCVLLALLACGAASFEPISVMCEINGFLIPAIIDTGAECTVMSSSCANRCRISQQIDTQFAGHAMGVGSSEILGAIEDLDFRIGPVDFQNKISILRDCKCDFLIGLDVLRRFDSDISIGERMLKLQVRGRTIRVPLVGQADSGSSAGMPRRGRGLRAARSAEARTRAQAASSFAPYPAPAAAAAAAVPEQYMEDMHSRVSAAASVYGGFVSFDWEDEEEEVHERDHSISMEGF